MSEFTDGIQYTIDVIESALESESLNTLPSRIAMALLVSGLKMDMEEM